MSILPPTVYVQGMRATFTPAIPTTNPPNPSIMPFHLIQKNKLSMHKTTAKIIMTEGYMHLWHKFLAMMNGKIMVRLKTET